MCPGASEAHREPMMNYELIRTLHTDRASRYRADAEVSRLRRLAGRRRFGHRWTVR